MPQYRSTPHTVTKIASADALFRYRTKTDINTNQHQQSKIDRVINRNDSLHKSKLKVYTDQKRHAKHITPVERRLCSSKEYTYNAPIWATGFALHIPARLDNSRFPFPTWGQVSPARRDFHRIFLHL